MNAKAVFFHAVALSVSVASIIIAAMYEEPTLLASGIFAVIGMVLVLTFSIMKGKSMKVSVTMFLSLCLLISVISCVFTDLGETYIGYLTRAPAYLGVGCLYLASLFAYFGLRLDRILTSIFIIIFETATSVSGALAINLMKMPLLDAGIINAIDNGSINQQFMMGFILAIVASIIVFYYLKGKNVALVKEDTLLEA